MIEGGFALLRSFYPFTDMTEKGRHLKFFGAAHAVKKSQTERKFTFISHSSGNWEV